jgi:small subunit ribosomal protein S6
MLKQYETTFIVDSHLSGEQIDEAIEKVTKFIEKNGGNIKYVDRWGKRRLAYEIAKKQYGYYVHIRFEVEGSNINSLEREFKLDDSIIRYLTVLVPRIVIKEENKHKQKPSPKIVSDDSTTTARSFSGNDSNHSENFMNDF